MSLAFIGRSEKGKFFEPINPSSTREAEDLIGSGELLDAYRAARQCGAEDIYLVRIAYHERSTQMRHLNYVYELLSSIPDLRYVVPLNVGLDKTFIDYPNFDRRRFGFVYKEGDRPVFEVGAADEVSKVLINGKRTINYSYDGQYLTVTNLSAPSYIEVVLREKPSFELTVEAQVYTETTDRVIDTVRKSYTYHPLTDGDTIDDIPLKDLFRRDYTPEDYYYVVRTVEGAVDTYSLLNGNNGIYTNFDYNKYLNEKTERVHFADRLAEMSDTSDYLTVLSAGGNEEDLKTTAREVKDRLGPTACYIVPVAGSSYYYGDNEAPNSVGVAALLSVYGGRKSITHDEIEGVRTVIDEYGYQERRRLADEGIITVYSSIRNGIVPFSGVTLADEDSPLHTLKNVDLALDIISDLKDIYSGIYLGDGYLPRKKERLADEIREYLSEHRALVDFDFEITELEDNELLIEYDLFVRGEMNDFHLSLTRKEV